MRTYYIIQTNCDCASDTIARTSMRWVNGPRCPGCNEILGCMQWMYVGTVRAKGDLDALQKWRKWREWLEREVEKLRAEK